MVAEILADGFTLGVVMMRRRRMGTRRFRWSPARVIAEADMSAIVMPLCGETQDVAVEFEDGLNDPPLSNMLVVDGFGIYESDGLALNDGDVTVTGVCDTMRIVSASGVGGTAVAVTVEVDNLQPVEGYVLSIQHEAGATLESSRRPARMPRRSGSSSRSPKIYPDGRHAGRRLRFRSSVRRPDAPGGHEEVARKVRLYLGPRVRMPGGR